MSYLSYNQIEDVADNFLLKYHPNGDIPVPIEDIIEIDLGLDIVPHKGLFEREAIDAFLSADLKELHIDEDHYMGRTNRSRFTLAHEVGHIELHSDIVKICKTIDDWKKEILGEGTGKDFFEYQANCFAGCVLMPREHALAKFESEKEAVKKSFEEANLEVPEDKLLATYSSSKICVDFDVSDKVAEIRLVNIFKNEK